MSFNLDSGFTLLDFLLIIEFILKIFIKQFEVQLALNLSALFIHSHFFYVFFQAFYF